MTAERFDVTVRQDNLLEDISSDIYLLQDAADFIPLSRFDHDGCVLGNGPNDVLQGSC